MQDLPDAVTVFLEIGEQSIDAGMFRDLYGCERYVEMLHIINEAWKGNVDSNPAFEEPSMILLEQIFTIDKSRIERFMGYASKAEMLRIDMALLVSPALNVLSGNRSE